MIDIYEIKRHWTELCVRHWEHTWIPTKNLLRNKKCLDYGMWKGLLNAKARKEFNCDTVIGIECNEEHRAVCRKFNAGTKLYESVEKLPNDVEVDIIFMHGVICLTGKIWRQELTMLLEKVSAEILHIRHKDYQLNELCSSNDRETNIHHLKDYNSSPSREKLIDFLKTNNYNTTHVDEHILLFKKNEKN